MNNRFFNPDLETRDLLLDKISRAQSNKTGIILSAILMVAAIGYLTWAIKNLRNNAQHNEFGEATVRDADLVLLTSSIFSTIVSLLLLTKIGVDRWIRNSPHIKISALMPQAFMTHLLQYATTHELPIDTNSKVEDVIKALESVRDVDLSHKIEIENNEFSDDQPSESTPLLR